MLIDDLRNNFTETLSHFSELGSKVNMIHYRRLFHASFRAFEQWTLVCFLSWGSSLRRYEHSNHAQVPDRPGEVVSVYF